MGTFRFRRSVRLAPGVRLNLNKRSVGVSVGTRGARYSLNSDGRRTSSVGIPGTGLSYRSQSGPRRSHGAPSQAGLPEWLWAVLAVSVVVVVVAAIKYWYVTVPVAVLVGGVWALSRRPVLYKSQPGQGMVAPTSSERSMYKAIAAQDANAVERVARKDASLRVFGLAVAAGLLISEIDDDRGPTARHVEELLEEVLASGEEPSSNPFRTRAAVSIPLDVDVGDGVVGGLDGTTRSALGLLLASHYGAIGRYDRAVEICRDLRTWGGPKDAKFRSYLGRLERALAEAMNPAAAE